MVLSIGNFRGEVKMAVKCNVEEEDFVEPPPQPRPSWLTPMRTQAQIDHGNEVMLSGGGRWFTEGTATQYSPGMLWFHDGTLGWHLHKDELHAPLTDSSWSNFSADAIVDISNKGKHQIYVEISSPFTAGESK